MADDPVTLGDQGLGLLGEKVEFRHAVAGARPVPLETQSPQSIEQVRHADGDDRGGFARARVLLRAAHQALQMHGRRVRDAGDARQWHEFREAGAWLRVGLDRAREHADVRQRLRVVGNRFEARRARRPTTPREVVQLRRRIRKQRVDRLPRTQRFGTRIDQQRRRVRQHHADRHARRADQDRPLEACGIVQRPREERTDRPDRHAQAAASDRQHAREIGHAPQQQEDAQVEHRLDLGHGRDEHDRGDRAEIGQHDPSDKQSGRVQGSRGALGHRRHRTHHEGRIRDHRGKHDADDDRHRGADGGLQASGHGPEFVQEHFERGAQMQHATGTGHEWTCACAAHPSIIPQGGSFVPSESSCPPSALVP